jgi:hypothetical protein
MVLLTILVFPIIKALGYDPVWFDHRGHGRRARLITPPIGMNVFVIKGTPGRAARDDLPRRDAVRRRANCPDRDPGGSPADRVGLPSTMSR